MITKFKGLSAKALLVMLASSAPPSVLAQTVDIPLPPVRSPVDERGVNLATGWAELVSADLSIGDGQSGLRFTRYWNGTAWRHDYIASIEGNSTSASVVIGDRTMTYSRSGNSFTSQQLDGSTLVLTSNGYTHTSADGTVVVFTNIENGASYYRKVAAIASTITYPSGEVLTLDYKVDGYTVTKPTFPEPTEETIYVKRLQSVRNNLGFQLKFTYASNVPGSVTAADDWYRVTRVTPPTTR